MPNWVTVAAVALVAFGAGWAAKSRRRRAPIHAPEFITSAARREPIARGWFRVVVIESDARTSCKDFRRWDDAASYANDAASEAGDAPPVAYVFDDELVAVHRGRAYWE